MNHSKSNSWRTMSFPLAVLLFVSAVGTVLMGLRVAWTGRLMYAALVWNLFLAWLPLLFALNVCRLYWAGRRGGWQLYASAALWLLFFPNAPYIFTDLVHLDRLAHTHYWVDLSLFLLMALTGFLLGFMSLYVMQSVVEHRLGKKAGWTFIPLVAGLTGFGIYLGRFLRFNSWDVVMHPLTLSHRVASLALHPLANPAANLVVPALFATFLFLGYLMLYALTHIRIQPMGGEEVR